MNAAGDESDNEIKLILDGSYTPGDYFEEPVSLQGAGYAVVIADGSIVATVDEPDPQVGQALRPEIERAIGRVFGAQQAMTCRPHEKTRLGMTRHHPDGRKDVWVSIDEPITATATVHPVDFRITNAEGQVTHDSRAERLDAQKQFREQCVRHAGDPVLSKIISSYNQSIDDPGNAFTHLYEVRDVLKKYLGDEGAKRKKKREDAVMIKIGVCQDDWEYLGKIANHNAIRGSRHAINLVLQDATEEELSRCRTIAQEMIQKYLNYLDQPTPDTESTE